MTMHHAGIELARERLNASAFSRAVINGELFTPTDALQAGFLDRITAPECLHSEALAQALLLKKINMQAHRQTKLKARKAWLERLDAAIEADRQHLA